MLGWKRKSSLESCMSSSGKIWHRREAWFDDDDDDDDGDGDGVCPEFIAKSGAIRPPRPRVRSPGGIRFPLSEYRYPGKVKKAQPQTRLPFASTNW